MDRLQEEEKWRTQVEKLTQEKAQMAQELEAASIEKAKMAQEIEAKNITIEEKNITIEAKNITIEAASIENAEMAQDLIEVKSISIKRLLKEPPVLGLRCLGYNTSHVNGKNHIPAQAKESVFNLTKIDFLENDKIRLKPSQLLIHFGLNTTEDTTETTFIKDYTTEADISNMVVAALNDAITLVWERTNGKYNLSVNNEYSLFSNRPDHLVIKDSERNIAIMAVEDKKPYGDDTCDENVLGQVYDYITAMHAFGQATPFVVLTTFAKSNVFWKDDRLSNDLALNEDKWKDLEPGWNALEPGKRNDLEKTPSPAKKVNNISPGSDDTQAKRVVAKNKITGKGKMVFALKWFTVKRKSVVAKTKITVRRKSTQKNERTGRNISISKVKGADDNKESDVKINFTAENEKFERNLLKSKNYGPHELVPLLVSVILCGLARNQGDASPSYKSLKKDDYFKDNVLRVEAEQEDKQEEKKTYAWGKLEARIASHPTKNMTLIPPFFLYVFDITARGDTSKAFHALDGYGYEHLIKMYVKRYDSDTKKYLKPDIFKNNADESTNRELEALKKFYPEFGNVFQKVWILGHACVIMPFFRPLDTVEQNNIQIQAEIKQKLIKLAKTGMTYDKIDVRWHHIGMYTREGKEEVVLFDLADLVPINKSRPATIARNQMKSLMDRRVVLSDLADLVPINESKPATIAKNQMKIVAKRIQLPRKSKQIQL